MPGNTGEKAGQYWWATARMPVMKVKAFWKLIPALLFAAGTMIGCGGHDHDHDHDGDGKPDHGPGADNNGS